MNTIVLDQMATEHGKTLALLAGFRTRLRTVQPCDTGTSLLQTDLVSGWFLQWEVPVTDPRVSVSS